MIAGDQGDGFDLFGREPAEVTVLDEVVRMPVVPVVADVHADVVQQRCVLEPVALTIGQAVRRSSLVEQRERKLGNLLGVRRRIMAALRQLDDAAAPHLRITLDFVDLGLVAFDVIKYQPLTQRHVAERHLGGAQALQDGVQEHRTGNDEVAPTRIEPRNPQARLQIQGDEPLAKTMDLRRGDTMISKVIGARDDATQAEDRA